jgi:hypothetical protein
VWQVHGTGQQATRAAGDGIHISKYINKIKEKQLIFLFQVFNKSYFVPTKHFHIDTLLAFNQEQ